MAPAPRVLKYLSGLSGNIDAAAFSRNPTELAETIDDVSQLLVIETCSGLNVGEPDALLGSLYDLIHRI